jgi:hypothetical protein
MRVFDLGTHLISPSISSSSGRLVYYPQGDEFVNDWNNDPSSTRNYQDLVRRASQEQFRCSSLGGGMYFTFSYRRNFLFVTLSTPIPSNGEHVGFTFDYDYTYYGNVTDIVVAKNGTYSTFDSVQNGVLFESVQYIEPPKFKLGPNRFSLEFAFPVNITANQKTINFVRAKRNGTILIELERRSYPFAFADHVDSNDCTNFNVPSRIEVESIAASVVILLVYILLFVLCIVFSTLQPLKSRGLSPFITLFFLFTHLIVELRYHADIAQVGPSLCIWYAYGYFPMMQMTFL